MLGFSALSAAPLATSSKNAVGVGVSSNVINAVVNSVASAGASNKVISSTNATFVSGTLSTNLVASIAIDATTLSTNTNIPSVNITASKTLATTSATFSLGNLEFPSEPTVLDTISSSIGITELDFSAKASTTTSSFNISTSLVDITPFLEIDVSQVLVGVSSTFSSNLVAPANNLFDYDAHADDYARTRTVYILPEGGYGLSKVAHINPENFTLVIDAHKDISTTVLITR